jgi:hypothetical protein
MESDSSNWTPKNWTPSRDPRRLPPKSGSLWYGSAVPEPQARQWSRDALRNSFIKNINNFFCIFFVLFIIKHLNIVYIKNYENFINYININIGFFHVRF